MAKGRAGFHGPYGLGFNQIFKGMGGPEYIVSILHGYTGETKEEAGSTFYENHTFSTGWIKMPPPLADGQVTFADGAPNDVKHMAEDVAAFLMWTAEPKLNDRKDTGFKAVLFLILLSSLLYLTNKRLWANVKGKKIHRIFSPEALEKPRLVRGFFMAVTVCFIPDNRAKLAAGWQTAPPLAPGGCATPSATSTVLPANVWHRWGHA